MDRFTFLVLTYNHADCIVENLESIKKVVERFSNGRKIDILVEDDCSKDRTVEIVNEWFLNNKTYFNELRVISHDNNIGTIRNLYSGIKSVKTKEFITIAGDDKCLSEDIFSFYEGLPDGITLTPCALMGEDSELNGRVHRNYFLARHLGKTKKIKKMMRYENFIVAPGVFFKAKYYRDSILWKRLFRFRLIEDYPTWRYFLDEKNLECHIEEKPYVAYRLGSGVSTQLDKNSLFYKEDQKLKKIYKIRNYMFPRYINPYFYIWVIVRLWNIFLMKKENVKLREKID